MRPFLFLLTVGHRVCRAALRAKHSAPSDCLSFVGIVLNYLNCFK